MPIFLALILGFAVFSGTIPAQTGTGLTAACAPTGATYVRTTLYFGLARPAGTITERQWKAFVQKEVTPRFPHGFTIWQAEGQWRGTDGHIGRERAKVLLVVHSGTAETREALSALVGSYKRLFQQESVLWETAAICAAF